MKEFLFVVILISLTFKGISQFMPNSGQGFQFAPLYNPAFTGIEGYRDLKLGYRYQWSGLGSDAPKFLNLALNFRLKEPLDLTLNAIRTSMAKSQNKDIPNIKGVIHGFGVNVFSEQFGLIKKAGAGINYSFHYPLSKKLRLAVGLSAVVDNIKINPSKIYLGINTKSSTREPIDPTSDEVIRNLINGASTNTNLNLRVGFLVYAPRFYVGFSYLPVVNAALESSETKILQSSYRGVIQAGYAFPLSATMDFKPSILALLQMDNRILIDYNAKVYIDQKIWVGLTYRDVKSIIGIVGFNLNERLGASYSYELSANEMRQFSDGSHDLVLSVRLNNFKRQRQQTW